MTVPDIPIQRMRLSDLVPHEANARKITSARLAKLKDKVTRWGDLGVIVYNKRTQRILSGHQRAKVMAQAGETEADVKVVDVDEIEEQVIMQALNEHDGTWDHALRAMSLQNINQERPELLPLTGMNMDKIRTLLEGLGQQVNLPKPEDLLETPTPTKPKKPVTKPGDVWVLGEHRLICGDATDPEAYRVLLKGEQADLVHTDPPYGVNYQSGAILNDHLQGDALYRLIGVSLEMMVKNAKDTAAFYVWHADSNADDFRDALKAAGLQRLQTVFWFKPTPSPTRSDYQYSHEPCYYAAKDGQRPPFYGTRANFTTWILEARATDGTAVTQVAKGLEVTDGDGHRLWIQAEPPVGKKVRRLRLLEGKTMQIQDGSGGTAWLLRRDQGTVHPTQKPVGLCAIPVKNSAKEGDIVLDPFGGSGSTLIACEQLKRRARLIELDAGWVEVVVERWETLTNQQAVRENDGKTLAEIRKAAKR